MMIKVLIADDHPLFRQGLRAALADSAGISVVAEVADGLAAVAAAVELGADVVLMDLHMPGGSGMDAIRQIAVSRPGTSVLVLTMFDNDESLLTAMRAGARGYLVKGADRDDILRAIQAVVAGEVVFGAGVAERALAFFAASPAGGRAARPFPELTDREVEILQLIGQGMSNTAIARRLTLADKTVRNHVSSVFAKLRVTDRSQAIIRAREAGLGTEALPIAERCPRRPPDGG
jgi:DNA-binding NarL/FixJ family response regulator